MFRLNSLLVAELPFRGWGLLGGLFSRTFVLKMNSTATALTALFDRIPRRHTLENVQEINGIVSEYEDILVSIEAVNAYYEKAIPVYFDELDVVRASIKKSTDNKASKKNKDHYFDEASGALKDTIQALIELYADGKTTA